MGPRRSPSFGLLTGRVLVGFYVIAERIEDESVLDYLRTIDEAIPRDIAAMIEGGQGYGPGRPSAELPGADASLEALAPAAS